MPQVKIPNWYSVTRGDERGSVLNDGPIYAYVPDDPQGIASDGGVIDIYPVSTSQRIILLPIESLHEGRFEGLVSEMLARHEFPMLEAGDYLYLGEWEDKANGHVLLIEDEADLKGCGSFSTIPGPPMHMHDGGEAPKSYAIRCDLDGSTVTLESLMGMVDIVMHMQEKTSGGVDLIAASEDAKLAERPDLRAVVKGAMQSDGGKRKQKGYKTRLNAPTVMQTDVLMNALAGRGDNHVRPQDYMSGSWIELPTGKGMKVRLLIANDYALDDALDDYQISERDRIWHDEVVSLAEKGYRTIRGSDLLKHAGYANPYDKGSADVMREAFASIEKMRRTQVAYDVTAERDAYNKRGIPLRQSVELEPIIDCKPILDQYIDDALDFEITLRGEKPVDALKLYRYASDKGQLVRADRKALTFKGLRLTLDHRVMWRYIYRQALTSQSNTIKVETMFRNIGIPLDDSKRSADKRRRMLDQLDRMLDAKEKDGTLKGYRWGSGKDGDRSRLTIELAKNAHEVVSTKLSNS